MFEKQLDIKRFAKQNSYVKISDVLKSTLMFFQGNPAFSNFSHGKFGVGPCEACPRGIRANNANRIIWVNVFCQPWVIDHCLFSRISCVGIGVSLGG